MSFKPKNSGQSNAPRNFEPRVNVKPKAGPRKARVSLIVDLGTLPRADYEENDGTTRPRKACQQLAIFADLVNDVVDYGGEIGKAQYRLMLNKMFGGVITGIDFTTMSPQDDKGKFIDGKPRQFHPRSRLFGLCKATGRPDIAIDDGPNGTDIEQLLNLPFIAEVEVKETTSDKKDKEGNDIVYVNVNYKGGSQVPMIETDELDNDGNAVEVQAPVADLKQPARLISFDNATVEDIKFIRLRLIEMIKQAEEYPGSNMQKAIEAYEAANGGAGASDDSHGDTDSEGPAPKTKVTPPKSKATAKPPAEKKPLAKGAEDLDDDVPF